MKNELVTREYLGRGIEFKMIEGMVYANANSMAESKKLENWKASPNTKRYIEALKNSLNFSELIISSEGRKGGTWIHEKLVLSLARYISVEFELWCDEQISTLIREGEVSIKPKSEEQIMASLLLDIYKGGQNAIASSKQLTEIEVRRATEPLKLEIKDKTDIIDDLTSDLDSVVLNKTFTNYCWKVSKRSGIKIQNVYNNVYEIFGRKHSIDLWKRKKTHDLKQVALVEKNKKYNRDNNLRGEDRVRPFNKKDACADVSMVEYICRVLGKGGSLIEVLAKVAEVSIEEIVEKYKMDAKKLGELL